ALSPRLAVNLRAGPGGDILLHFNPRPAQGVLVRNSLLAGAWGHEERELPPEQPPLGPFQQGAHFDVS
ncbi:LEG4 protein, partial [Bucco capensis]|nr:LEG4 protein [Bucco capensis]